MISDDMALTWHKAISRRHSTRNYDGRPVPEAHSATWPRCYLVLVRCVGAPVPHLSQRIHPVSLQVSSARS